jgi:hypothetical protein
MLPRDEGGHGPPCCRRLLLLLPLLLLLGRARTSNPFPRLLVAQQNVREGLRVSGSQLSGREGAHVRIVRLDALAALEGDGALEEVVHAERAAARHAGDARVEKPAVHEPRDVDKREGRRQQLVQDLAERRVGVLWAMHRPDQVKLDAGDATAQALPRRELLESGEKALLVVDARDVPASAREP